VAVGYLVQRLPEANEAQIVKMLNHEAALPPLREAIADSGDDARAWMVARLLGDIPYVTLEETEVFFGCNCSHGRVLGAITTLGRDELLDIISKREALQTDCDYCGAHYEVGVETLRGMLDLQ
jgi:molecular chaperone Hsp33